MTDTPRWRSVALGAAYALLAVALLVVGARRVMLAAATLVFAVVEW